MSEFRGLFLRAICAGTVAGLIWFGAQYLTTIPLIEKAEVYEAAAHPQHDEGWQPADGFERNAFTALATVLTGIGFAAVLFSILALSGRQLDVKRGALWGLAGFACFNLAPALGLPPQPPGVAAANVFDRQIWWTATVVATAVGLYMLAPRSRRWLIRVGGAMCLGLPHVIGAPVPSGGSVVPAELVRRFVIASLAASGIFWLALGVAGGLINGRSARSAGEHADKP